MGKTEWDRIRRCVEKTGSFEIRDGSGTTEILKHGRGSYAVYHREGMERNCVDTAGSLDYLRYLFED